MKKALFLTAICAALTACGGGSGGGSDPAPNPTPVPTVQCTLPMIASATTYYGVTPNGDTGTWNFTQNGTSLSVSNVVTPAFNTLQPQTNTFTATASNNNCAFTNTTSGIQGIATAFNGDIATSASQYGNRPAFLIANPTTTQASLAGTYNAVGFEKEIGSVARSSYRQLVINQNGTGGTINRWENGVNTARHVISLSQNGQGFTVAIEPDPQFPNDVYEVIGTAYFKVSGSSKVVALATADIDNTGSTPAYIQGMMIGSTDSTTFPVGGYVDNNYDDGQAYTDAWTGGVYVTNTTVQPSQGSAITYLNNQPQTGFIGIPFDANQPVDALISSALGFFAATPQADADVPPVNPNGASITFAVRPQQ